MLGLGWSEMLVIATVVLIVVGPKDLPVMLRNLGRMMGSVRRISNDFRREIDKAIAVDEFKDAKKAISDPLSKTTSEITREFNSIRNGKVEPSGKLKPGKEGEESVFDEIRSQAGISEEKPAGPSAAAASLKAKVTEQQARAKAAAEAEKAEAEVVAKKPAAPKKPAAAKSAKAAAEPKAAKAPAKHASAKAAGGKATPAPRRKTAAKPESGEAKS